LPAAEITSWYRSKYSTSLTITRRFRSPWSPPPENREVGGRIPTMPVPVVRTAPSAANAQGLCEACNYAKQAVGWRARPGPAGDVETTLPTGHRYRTRAPAIATIRTRPFRLDVVLSG
jgi:hypothetical protein